MTMTFVPHNLINNENFFKAKDPISALTHFIPFLLSICVFPFLLIHASLNGHGSVDLIALSVFALTVSMLYGASSAYHTFNLRSEKGNRVLRKIDHSMIGYLIAGTYTPACVIALGLNKLGRVLLVSIWALAILASCFKLIWINCPKWVSSLLYLLMGWGCIPLLPSLYRYNRSVLLLFIIAGIFYTLGALIYAIKPNWLERNKYFKSHEIFHLFVVAGTASFYISFFFLAS